MPLSIYSYGAGMPTYHPADVKALTDDLHQIVPGDLDLSFEGDFAQSFEVDFVPVRWGSSGNY